MKKIILVLLVVLAGCGEVAQDEPTEEFVSELSEEEKEIFYQETQEDGEYTAQSQELFNIWGNFSQEHKDSVVDIIIDEGMSQDLLDLLYRVEEHQEIRGYALDNPEGYPELTDGEREYLGVSDPEVVPERWDSETIEWVQDFDNLSSSQKMQARSINTTEIEDTSGDGLIDPFAVELGLDPDKEHSIAHRVEQLDRIGENEIQWILRVQELDTTQKTLAREHGFLDQKRISESNLRNLEEGEEIIQGVEKEYSEPIVQILTSVAEDGTIDEQEKEFVMIAEEMEHNKDERWSKWGQAREHGLLFESAENVNRDVLWGLSDNSNNGIINAEEEDFGTNPDLRHTSRDGIPDHYKWGPLQAMGYDIEGGTPDVFLEVGSSSGTSVPSTSDLEREISDGIDGDLHIEECTTGGQAISQRSESSISEERALEEYGFHFAYTTHGGVELNNEQVLGLVTQGHWGQSYALVDGTQPDSEIWLAHEVGHLLGIHENMFTGIDSREYSSSEYNSVMNYNTPSSVTFSNGSPYNDFDAMEDMEYGSDYTYMERLEEMWRSGDIEVPC